ncbi:MAG TPA: MATE family efflux transporter [Pseudoflavonifractor sp.]|nr:MATE family efflux transporter [Pseudoflavonifractor sp.]
MFSYLKRGRQFYLNILLLALPIILQNLVITTLGLMDTFMVGMLGEAPLAAVNLANIPMFVIQLILFGLQSGSSVLISQFWGKRDTESINRVIGIGCYMAWSITIVFALVTVFLPEQLMGLLTDNAELIGPAAEYTRIVGPSFLFTCITSVYAGAHRSMENPKLGFIIFSISTSVDVFLNWLLIFGNLGAPAMGIAGAAWSTLWARMLEFAIVVVYAFTNRRFRLKLSLLLRPGTALAAKFAQYAAPVLLNESLWGLGTSLYKVIMGHMAGSTEILAARALAGGIEDICTVVIFAVAATAGIVVGREIGAGRDKETVYQVGLTMGTLAIGCGAAVGAFMLAGTRLLLAPLVYPLFQLSPSAAGICTMMLTFTAVVLPLRSFDSTNTVGILRGGGDVHMAMLIDILPLWLVAIPLAALFGLALQWGIFAVYVGICMENVVKFGFGISRLRSRVWINDVTEISRSQAA